MNTAILLVVLLLVCIAGYSFLRRSKSNDVEIIEDHEYFTKLWLWPRDEHTRWEAELATGSNTSVGFHAEDNYLTTDDPMPTLSEIEFCRRYDRNLAGLVDKCRQGLARAWQEWFDEELPAEVEAELILDGFSVPVGGDESQTWGVTFFCPKAGHYFNIKVHGGDSDLESIDG